MKIALISLILLAFFPTGISKSLDVAGWNCNAYSWKPGCPPGNPGNSRNLIAVAVKLLNAVVVKGGHINIVAAIHRNTSGKIKLSVVGSKTAPLPQIVAVAIELFNAGVVSVNHINIVAAVHRDTFRVIELSVVGSISRIYSIEKAPPNGD